MLTDGDRAQMRADMLAIRGDREESIVIRRGATTLAAQSVRIARAGAGQSARRADSAGAEQAMQRMIVMGGVGFDVRPQDRFNDSSGRLFEVVMVRPNRSAAVVAEAEAVQ